MSGAVEGVALLPCPFCGWDAKASTTLDQPESHFVLCQRCETMGAYFATSSEAITAWNTRTTPPARSYADGVDFRALLIEAGRNAGALLDDRVSDAFLEGIPEEVRLKIERLREDTRTIQRNTAIYRQEARAEADAAIERAAEANKRADNMAEANRRLLAIFEADPAAIRLLSQEP